MDLWHGCWTAEAVEADWLPDGFHEVVGFEEGGDGYPMDWIAGKN